MCVRLLLVAHRPHSTTAMHHPLQELLVSYFIGVQPEVREKSSNERAAARVGLKLPQLPDE